MFFFFLGSILRSFGKFKFELRSEVFFDINTPEEYRRTMNLLIYDRSLLNLLLSVTLRLRNVVKFYLLPDASPSTEGPSYCSHVSASCSCSAATP